MMGTKPSLATCTTFCGSLTPSYRRTATYMALGYLLKRGRDPSAPPQVDQRAQCEGLVGLTQLPRILFYLQSSENANSTQFVNKGKKKGAGPLRPRPFQPSTPSGSKG